MAEVQPGLELQDKLWPIGNKMTGGGDQLFIITIMKGFI